MLTAASVSELLGIRLRACSHLPANPHVDIPSIQRLQVRKENSRDVGSVGVKGVHSRVRVLGLEVVPSCRDEALTSAQLGPCPSA